MKNFRISFWTFCIFSVICGFKVHSSPSATFCRICDSHDPLALDNCYQTTGKQHSVCRESCLTQFDMTSSGLRVRKSCTDNATCVSEWWQKSFSEPECQEQQLTAPGASLSPGRVCSICCNAARDSNIYCSDDLFPPSSTLVQYPGITLPPRAAVTTQVKVNPPSTDSTSTVQLTTRQDLINLQDSIKYPSPMTCAYCPHIDQKRFSSCAASIRCGADKPLCMTSFYDDGRSNLTEVKRCAAVSECWDLWYNTTRLSSDCMGDGDHDPYSWTGTKSGECHYCCHTPLGQEQAWCNKPMWPTRPGNLVDMFDYESSLSASKTTTVRAQSSTQTQSTTAGRIQSATTTPAQTQTTTKRTTQEPSTVDQTVVQQLTTTTTTTTATQTVQQTTVKQTDGTTLPTTPSITTSTDQTDTRLPAWTAGSFNNVSDTEPNTPDLNNSTTTATMIDITTTRTPLVDVNVTGSVLSTFNATAAATNTQDYTTSFENENNITTLTPTFDLNVTDVELTTMAEPTTIKDDVSTTQPSITVTSSSTLNATNDDQPTAPAAASTATLERTTTTAFITAGRNETTDPAALYMSDPTLLHSDHQNLFSTTAATETSTGEMMTTTPPPPAPTPPRLRCEACDDVTGQGGDCQSGRIEFCPDDEDYCLNTVTFSSAAGGTPSMDVVKKCASFQACQSSNINSADCYNSDISDASTVNPGTRCNFCCNETAATGVPCNANVRPDKPINFLPKRPAVVRRSCFQCGDPSSGKPCGPGDLLLGMSKPCPLDKQFCMNDIFDKSGSGRTIYKRCVDEAECRNKWFKESSDTNECADYDPRASDTSDLTCHFCCTEDGCNRPTKPAENTLWTPFYTAP